MAEYSDGSIAVDTEIDTEGFLKDSEKLKKAITSLSRRIDSIGQQMKTAIAKNNAAAVETLNRRFAESQAQAEALRSKLEGFSHVKILSGDYIRITAEIEKADAAMNRLIDRKNKLIAMGSDKASAQWQETQKAIEETTAKLEFYRKRARETQLDVNFMVSPEQRAEVHASGPDMWGTYIAELEELKKQIASDQAEAGKLETALAKLTTRQEQLKASGADQGSRQYQSLLYDMEQLRVKQEELTAAREKMEADGTAFKMGDTTSEFEQLNRQMEETEQQMEQVEQAKERAFSLPSASGLLGFLSGATRGALNVAANLARIVGSGALSYLRKLAAGAKNAAIQLMKLAGNAIASGIRRIGSLAASAGKSLFGMGKDAKKSSGGLNIGLKALMKYGLGVRSVFALIRRLRTAIVDAFKNMAQKVPEVNKSLSMLASSLDRMKNSLATAFQPILTAVAPYLAQFMDMISGALTKVGEFFAALTGQKYVYRATKAQIDYAKSLDKTKKSAKEAKNQLAGFDDLYILSENKSSDSSSDSETPTSDFEKIPVESKIADFVKRIRDAFMSGDFYKIGEIIADTVYGWFSRIDWVKVGTIIGRGIMALADMMLGFAESFPWADVGIRLANGLNALFDAINPVKIAKAIIAVFNGALDALLAFIDTFKWEKHGKKLAAGIRQFIKDLPVEKLGAVLRKAIVGILKFIRPALADKETWTAAGEKLGSLLNELFKGKPGKDNIWTELEGAIVDLADGVITALKNFVATFKWGENGRVFHDAVFKLVEDFPLNDLGVALMDLLKGSLEFMNETFGDQELFNTLGGKLADFMNTVFSKQETWDEIGETANNMLKDVLSFSKGFLEKFEPETAANAIKAALGKIEWDGIASETWELLKTAFQKSGSFIDALFSNGNEEEGEGDSLGARIGTKLSEAINEAINNVIPWSEIGKTFNELLNNGLDFLTNFVTNFDAEGFADGVCNALEKVEWGKIANKIITLLLEAIGKFDSMLRESIYRFFGVEDKDKQLEMKVTQMAGELFAAGAYATYQEAEKAAKDFYGVGEDLATDMADGLTDGMESKKSDVSDAMDDTFMNPYETNIVGRDGYDAHSPSRTTEALGKDVMEGFAGGLEGQKNDADQRSKTLFEGLFSTIVATASAMQDFQTIILNALGNLEKHFPTRMNTYKNIFETGWADINGVVSDGVTTMKSTIQDQWWDSVGSNIVSGIQRGIYDGWDWLRDTVWNLARSLLNTAKDALGIHSPSRMFRDQVGMMLGLGVAEGMEDSEPTILDSVAGVAEAMAEEMNSAKLTANIGTKGSGLDAALNTFSDKVADSFSALADRLEAIAASVTFRMPAVADGGILPYSVKGKSGSAADGLIEALKAFTDEQLIHALIQMFNNQTTALVRAIEQYCTTNINLDKRSLTDAIIDEINRRTRMTGKSPLLI